MKSMEDGIARVGLSQDANTGDNWRADVNYDRQINILDLLFV